MSWQGLVLFALVDEFFLLATERWNRNCGCNGKREKASCW